MAERYPSFIDDHDFALGYICNYSGDASACAGKNAIQMQGKGSGIATYGAGKGSNDKEDGYMNAIYPEIKNNEALYSIEFREKTIKIMGDNITIKFQVLVKI